MVSQLFPIDARRPNAVRRPDDDRSRSGPTEECGAPPPPARHRLSSARGGDRDAFVGRPARGQLRWASATGPGRRNFLRGGLQWTGRGIVGVLGPRSRGVGRGPSAHEPLFGAARGGAVLLSRDALVSTLARGRASGGGLAELMTSDQ